MALSDSTQPDFTIIAWFVRNMKDEDINIFVNILLVCSEMDLLGGTEFALGGCKMRSNASREWNGTSNDLAKKKDKIEKTVLIHFTRCSLVRACFDSISTSRHIAQKTAQRRISKTLSAIKI